MASRYRESTNRGIGYDWLWYLHSHLFIHSVNALTDAFLRISNDRGTPKVLQELVIFVMAGGTHLGIFCTRIWCLPGERFVKFDDTFLPPASFKSNEMWCFMLLLCHAKCEWKYSILSVCCSTSAPMHVIACALTGAMWCFAQWAPFEVHYIIKRDFALHIENANNSVVMQNKSSDYQW